MRCVGKIVRPSSRVDTSTTIIHAVASVPSSSWNASAVSYRWWPSAIRSCRVRHVGDRVEPPQPLAAVREVGLARGQLDGVAVVEQEDRLELRARGAKQAQSSFLRTGVRALVREHDAVLVRLESQRDDDAVARALDSVGTDVRLRERPRCRLLVAREDPVATPGREITCGVVLGVRERQVDDVVRASCEVPGASSSVDHVVRRRDQSVERTGRLGIAFRTKSTHLCHGWTVP